jgi:hypothetical protein
MKVLKSLYINHLFFYILLGIGGVFFISFFVKWMFDVAVVLLLLFLLVTVIDLFVLYSGRKGIEAERELPDRLSNGDDNIIRISLKNNYPIPVSLDIIDEIPFQFQKRDFLVQLQLKGGEPKGIESFRKAERVCEIAATSCCEALYFLRECGYRYLSFVYSVAEIRHDGILQSFDTIWFETYPSHRPYHGV